MSAAAPTITPAAAGRRTTPDGFIDARGRGGRHHESGRGIVPPVDAARPRRSTILDAVRTSLAAYGPRHPRRVDSTTGGGERRLHIKDLESDRSPGLAVSRPPRREPDRADEIGSRRIPEIAIEVVSPGSRLRGRRRKPEGRLRSGVQVRPTVDVEGQAMKGLVHSGGRWAERPFRPPAVHKAGRLPGPEFSRAAVFEGP